MVGCVIRTDDRMRRRTAEYVPDAGSDGSDQCPLPETALRKRYGGKDDGEAEQYPESAQSDIADDPGGKRLDPGFQVKVLYGGFPVRSGNSGRIGRNPACGCAADQRNDGLVPAGYRRLFETGSACIWHPQCG